MKTILRWLTRITAGLILVIMAAATTIFLISEARLNRTYTIAEEPISIPTDEESIMNGKRLTYVHACVECHGNDMAGRVILSDPMFGTFHGANLTPGEGGAGQTFTDEDWIRAIRHGIGTDQKALLVMPAQDYNTLSLDDLQDIVAYLKSLEPVDNVGATNTIGPMARVLIAVGAIPLSAEVIDHEQPIVEEIAVGLSAEYGEYLVTTCKGCHGTDLSGGPLQGPVAGTASNLTLAGDVAGWTENDFIRAMREGIRPDGSQISEVMPWKVYGPAYTELELQAIWLYLQNLPPITTEAN